MQTVWLQVLLVMLGGSLLKSLTVSSLLWAGIDIAVFGGAYLVIKRHPYVDAKNSLQFLGALTGINLLVDFGLIGGVAVNVLMVGMVAWIFFKTRKR